MTLLRTERAGLALALVAALACAPARAQDRPDAVAPYRYPLPPAAPPDALEQQKAMAYRNELAAQQRQLQQQQADGAFGPSGWRALSETNREIGRVDQFLQR